jgi:hypothetical protein
MSAIDNLSDSNVEAILPTLRRVAIGMGLSSMDRIAALTFLAAIEEGSSAPLVKLGPGGDFTREYRG